MKADPKYGYYPWWPEDGNEWVYPEDVDLARQMIPSPRVFRRDGELGPFVVLHYGDVQLRVMRTLWQEVTPEGYEIGDWVEVLSRGFKNTPRTAIIKEITWDTTARAMRYQVAENDQLIPNQYGADDLRHVDPPRIQ